MFFGNVDPLLVTYFLKIFAKPGDSPYSLLQETYEDVFKYIKVLKKNILFKHKFNNNQKAGEVKEEKKQANNRKREKTEQLILPLFKQYTSTLESNQSIYYKEKLEEKNVYSLKAAEESQRYKVQTDIGVEKVDSSKYFFLS